MTGSARSDQRSTDRQPGATSDRDEFARLTDPFRRELLAHCYRMLGSADDAEDLVQETYLRAWRAYTRFEGRASLRTWLYRIATNVCLTALERRGRRPLPSGLGGPSADPEGPLAYGAEVPWLQPMPAALLTAASADPAGIVASRQGMRLALVAAMQHLPARQRAVLILRDVLTWRADEVAELLGTTTTAVNSVLQRARAQLREVAPSEEEIAEPDDPSQRALLDRYTAAFESTDLAALLKLLADDVVLEMPPYATWFAGRATIGRFLAQRSFDPAAKFDNADKFRLVTTAANGQLAVAVYLRDEDALHRAHMVQVLSFAAGRISRIVAFLDPGLFPLFGLPQVCPATVGGPPAARR